MTSASTGTTLPFSLPPGMVSYTYRNEFQQDVSATLDHIQGLGITDLEFSSLFDHSADELRRMLDARELRCSSYGVGLADLQSKTDVIIADAKHLGASFVRVAWIPHESPFDQADAESTAAIFNRIGTILRDHGLTFCYHNHGYEFAPHGSQTLFDLMVQATDPEAVAFELDILWAHFPGADPAQLLRTYPERFRLMHLKDLRRGVVGDLTGKTAQQNDVALGDGQLNLPEILQAAGQSSISHYYIEDESPSVATQVPRSLAYLAALTSDAPR